MPHRTHTPAPMSHLGPMALAAILTAPALAYDVNDQLAVNVLAAVSMQCQELSGDTQAPNTCRGAAPLQPELFYNPTQQDQIFIKLGFAAGNGINDVSPFALTPWAADLEDDTQDINGSGRSYLFEAWYAHTFELGTDNKVQITGGIIDPAFYVNENAYANNEFTQFMNEAFVNSRNAFLPAYDWGGVLVWKYKDLTFSGLGMNVAENDDGRNYNYYAAEADWHVETGLGEGNYRLMYSGGSRAFPDPDGDAMEKLSAFNLSFDQALGKVVGVFLRLGWQAEEASVDYQAAYTGGLDFKGAAWGRENDNLGIAYGYMSGGNQDIDRSNAFEAYYRLAVNDHLALTADVQYMEDLYKDDTSVSGWVYGARALVEF